MTHTWKASRFVAVALAMSLAFPTLTMTAGCGNKGSDDTAATAPTSSGGTMDNSAPTPVAAPQQKPGLTTKQKVVLIGGAALLYFLYRKYQAQNASQAANTTGANGKPQLYRSQNGGVYYRDPKTHQPIWLTAPAQQMSVPADQLSQYAPEYTKYQGQDAPAPPAGAPSQSFSQLDPSLAGSSM